jgi:T5SS/PEP-CTERM-associated repeat protein
MSGGSLTNTGRTYVALGASTGRMNLTGGTYDNVNNELFIIGDSAGSNGTVTVNGSTALLNSRGDIWVGQGAGGNGTFNLNSGNVTVGNWLAIGREGGTGVFNMTGGTLTKQTDNHIIVGSLGGNGTVNQSGGDVNVINNNEVFLGENADAIALWDMSGGTLQTAATHVAWRGGTSEVRVRNSGSWTTGYLNVGEGTNNGKGIVNQTGGTVTANTWIAVGLGSSQTAEYNLSGGTTTASGFEVGADSPGLVNVSATGVLNAINVIEVPTRNGSGTFNIIGGTVNTANFQQGGRDGNVGTGVTNQSGGVVNVSGVLDVQRLGVGTGAYNLSGGTLSVDGAINLNLGTFTFTGGKITRSNPGIITLSGR